MQMTLSDLNKVISLAKEASDIILDFYRTQNFIQNMKADKTPVTSADLSSHKFLVEHLAQLTPNIPVLSEESAHISLQERCQWERYWLIDPLDGTKEFINRTGDFSVMIALVEHNRPCLGVIYSPIKKLCFYAVKDAGAWMQEAEHPAVLLPKNEKHLIGNKIKILISPHFDVNYLQGKLSTEYEYEYEKIGSASLKSCFIAAGKADAYLRIGPTGEWDTAAAECILKEVQGDICNLSLQPLTYNQRDVLINPDFIAMGPKNFPWCHILGKLYKG